MTKPLIADTRWAVDGTDADASNVAAPPSGLRDTGYPFGAIPASSFDNFWQNRAYRWFQYLNAGNLVGNHTINGTLAVGGQSFSYPAAVFTASSATDLLTITAHGLILGDGPLQVSNSGGALPSGLTAATNYWVIPNDANTFRLASSFLAAVASISIDLLTNGTGTQSIASTVSTTRPADASVARTLTVTGTAVAGAIVTGGTSVSLLSPFIANSVTNTMAVDGHGLLTGDGPFRVLNSGGALPVPLVAATDYWIIRTSQDKFSLATTRANALNGVFIDLTTAGTGTNTIVSISATRTGDITTFGRVTADVISADIAISNDISRRNVFWRQFFPTSWTTILGSAPTLVTNPAPGVGGSAFPVWRFAGGTPATEAFTRVPYEGGDTLHSVVLEVLGDGAIDWFADISIITSIGTGGVSTTISANDTGSFNQPAVWSYDTSMVTVPTVLPSISSLGFVMAMQSTSGALHLGNLFLGFTR